MKFIAVAMLALALLGCGPPPSGRIVDTNFAPAHTEDYQSYEVQYYRNECQYNYSSKRTDCRNVPVYWYVTRTRKVPDKWSIQIEGNCRPHETSATVVECFRQWIEVNQANYDAATAGTLTWWGPTPVPPAKGL